MPLNVANWNDKQLDELADLLRASDYSAVASFIANNFLATGSRVMTNPTQTTLRVTVNGVDGKYVDLSPGIFIHNSLCSDIFTTQTVNILDPAGTGWGPGQNADDTHPRWDIIEVKNNELVHEPLLRWFVDDSVDPNTYSQQLANTLIDKAYYDIVVKPGTPGAIPVVPDPDAGYFTIAEIYVPADPTHANPILPANIYDTVGVSNKIPIPSWTPSTRVLRIEFWSSLFGTDHYLTTGYHREGAWHIGSDLVTSTASELNKLHGTGSSVNPANLISLTDGSSVTIHTHSSLTMSFLDTPVVLSSGGSQFGWTNLAIGAHAIAILQATLGVYPYYYQTGNYRLAFRKKGHTFNSGYAARLDNYAYSTWEYSNPSINSGQFFIPISADGYIQATVELLSGGCSMGYEIILLGYIG